LRFFDLETTGLSGGTGTVAFLASVGKVGEGGDFRLDQLFLEDYPGESAFLTLLLNLLDPGTTVVSYNGRAFDMPLLRTRCVMNGLSTPSLAHVDALFACRRLWRRVYGGASLGLLEREVLGVLREEDLPGAMVPEVWLSFVRGADNPLMRLVLSHNAGDVESLARLVARTQEVFDSPVSRIGLGDLDLSGLGRTLISAGRFREGEEILEAALGEGDTSSGFILGRRYRRAGRVGDCARIAAMLPPGGFRNAFELSRLYESGDLAESVRWAREALRLAEGEPDRKVSARRLARLERRLTGR
jgi:hypothetical protein